jgi:hypothetical protein
MSQRLNEAYTWVRQNLFPEWDRDGAWKIKEGYGPVYYTQPSWELYEGECDLDNQRIYIVPKRLQKKSTNEIYETITHEIAHARSSDSHLEEGGWPQEMEEAASRSRDLGLIELAVLIEQDKEDTAKFEED